MSFEPDDIDHELTIEDLLCEILDQIKMQTEILKEISGTDITEGDIHV